MSPRGRRRRVPARVERMVHMVRALPRGRVAGVERAVA